jgi:hypothetical protein
MLVPGGLMTLAKGQSSEKKETGTNQSVKQESPVQSSARNCPAGCAMLFTSDLAPRRIWKPQENDQSHGGLTLCALVCVIRMCMLKEGTGPPAPRVLPVHMTLKLRILDVGEVQCQSLHSGSSNQSESMQMKDATDSECDVLVSSLTSSSPCPPITIKVCIQEVKPPGFSALLSAFLDCSTMGNFIHP